MTQLCPLCADHLPDVAEIEALCFSRPWSKSSLTLLTTPPNGGFVAIADGTAVGYVGFLGVVDELEITNVAVRPTHRRRGLAEALLQCLEAYAQQQGTARITLDVRASNRPAIALYEKMGFVPCGTRKNFYSFPKEDAVIYEKQLTP